MAQDDEPPFSLFDGPPVGDAPFALGAEQVLANRYQLGERLRIGASGAVYRGQDVRTGRPVAIKLLQWWDDDATAMHRFRREAEIVRRLAHPNIVQMLDFGEAEDVLYLVLELLEGDDLAILLHGKQHVADHATLVSIDEQLASALDAVHRAGVIHRDLKPTNIFVRGYPDTPTVKLLDFGMSKLVGGASGVTGSNQILGSMGYMSPEQVLGKSAGVDHRADLYSLGAIVYRMLVGRPPFGEKTLAELSQAVLSHEPPPPSSLRTLSKAVDAVLARALAKSPADRYGTAAAFHDDLVAALAP